MCHEQFKNQTTSRHFFEKQSKTLKCTPVCNVYKCFLREGGAKEPFGFLTGQIFSKIWLVNSFSFNNLKLCEQMGSTKANTTD